MTLQKSKTTSIMASFATLKSLSDAKRYQSPYQILSEFINHIIISDSLYSFSAVEMKNRLNSHFSFSIPEAVVKTALKNVPGTISANGIYTISETVTHADKVFEEVIKESDKCETRIIKLLSEYISVKTANTMISEEMLTKELVCFLVEDESLHSSEYSELIGEFVLKNEQNKEIRDALNKIRQGSILYIGLSHSIVETGSITKPLTLYLGTEVLFSLVGYNGEIFKRFADDFFAQVRSANSGKEKKITIHYFSETKKEIDEFFWTASEIVEGCRPHILDKPAMKAITDGCHTATDVDVEKADFYYKLQYSFGITEDPKDNYYGEDDFSNNLESSDYDENDGKKNEAIKVISHINKLRNGETFSSDIESGHIFVTNTKATLAMSKQLSKEIKESKDLDKICNFAISLDRITCLLWYKLGNGFSNNDFPSSVDSALKARIILSSSIAKNAEREFEKIKKEYADGLINDDQAKGRIIMLRNKPVLPEDLQGDDIDEIMDFTPEYLSRYEEQVKKNKIDLEEKEAIIENLKADSERKLSEKDETIATQASAIEDFSKENAMFRDELDKYHQKEAEKKRKKDRRRNIFRFILSIAWKAGLIIPIIAVAIYAEAKLNSKIPTYISMCVSAVDIILTLWSALKIDREKYLKKNENE